MQVNTYWNREADISTRTRRRSRKKIPAPTAVDLFCGCGGLTLGLKRAGFHVIGAVDVDPLSIETYKKNHPEVRLWQQDIRKLSGTTVMGTLGLAKGHLDLLAGCPPCQGFSSMKTLNGGKQVRDPGQKDLVFQFLRFVKKLRPKILMMENVPGLADDRRMSLLLRKLLRLGYKCDIKILDAANYAVPQRRRRMILIGGYRRKVAFGRPARCSRTVRDAIGFLPIPSKSPDPLHALTEKRSKRVARLIRSIPSNGGSRLDLGRRKQLPCHQKCNGFKDVYGRMKWHGVSPTITSGCTNPSKGRFLHPVQHRAITLREAALLQGFPSNYYFSLKCGKQGAATLIGNALPPEFIRRHAVRIAEILTQPL